MQSGTEYSRGLLWISITRNSNSTLKVKVHHALGLRLSDKLINIQESKVTVQMLSGSSRANLFTVSAKSIQHRHYGTTSILKFNGVFHLNAPVAELSRKRLMFSVYVRGSDETKVEELAGCFSLSVSNLAGAHSSSKLVNSWFFLLQPEPGKTENVMVLVDSPKLLLEDMQKGHRVGCDGSRELFMKEENLLIPSADGSVCMGHNLEGQLETDVDAAFCCLLEDNCCSFGRMNILDNSSSSIYTSARDISKDQSFDLQNSERLKSINGHTAQISVESVQWNMPCGEYKRDPPETPFRHRNNTLLLRGRKRLGVDTMYGLRRQLEFENTSMDQQIKLGCKAANDRPNVEMQVGDDETRGLKLNVGERLTTTCCDTSRLLEAFKVRMMKAKLKKERKDRQKSEANITRNNSSPGINKQKTFPEKQLEDLDAAERDFQNFLLSADSLYMDQKVWNEHRNKREFIPRDILEDFGIVSPLGTNDSDMLSSSRDILSLSLSQIQHSATSTPFLKDQRIPLMAIQRRVIGFHRYSQRQELGFSLTEISGTAPTMTGNNSSFQIMNDTADGCYMVSTGFSTSRDGPESKTQINDDFNQINSFSSMCIDRHGLNESSYYDVISDSSRDFGYFPESLANLSHSTLSVLSTQEFSSYSTHNRLLSDQSNQSGNKLSVGHLDISHQYVNKAFVPGSMNTSHRFPTTKQEAIDIDDSRLSCGIISVGDSSRQLIRNVIPGSSPWRRAGQGSVNDDEGMSTSGSSNSFSSGSSCSCRSGCSSNNSDCVSNQIYKNHFTVSRSNSSPFSTSNFNRCHCVAKNSNNSHCISHHNAGNHFMASHGSNMAGINQHSITSSVCCPPLLESFDITNQGGRSRVVVSKVAANSLAHDWDLAPGDGIVAINHVDVRSMTCDQVVRMLRDMCMDVRLEVERVAQVFFLD